MLDGGNERRGGEAVPGQLGGEAGHRHANGHLVHADLEVPGRPDAGIGRHQQDGAHGHGMAGARQHHGDGRRVDLDGELGAGLQERHGGVRAGGHDREVEAP